MTEAQQGARADSMFTANDTAFGGLPGDTVWFDTAYFRGPIIADTAYADVQFPDSTTPALPVASVWIILCAFGLFFALWRKRK